MEIGFGEIVVIAIIVLILYGKRLPEVSRNLGKMLYNLKKSYEEAKQDLVNLDNGKNQSTQNKGLLPDNKPADSANVKSSSKIDLPDVNAGKPVDESELPYDKNDNLAG